MTTSHAPAFKVFRIKPRRCAHQVYSTFAFISRAISSAIRFSKPSPLLFEKGKLFGSAQMRRTRGQVGRCDCDGSFDCLPACCWPLPVQERRKENERHQSNKKGWRA